MDTDAVNAVISLLKSIDTNIARLAGQKKDTPPANETDEMAAYYLRFTTSMAGVARLMARDHGFDKDKIERQLHRSCPGFRDLRDMLLGKKTVDLKNTKSFRDDQYGREDDRSELDRLIDEQERDMNE